MERSLRIWRDGRSLQKSISLTLSLSHSLWSNSFAFVPSLRCQMFTFFLDFQTKKKTKKNSTKKEQRDMSESKDAARERKRFVDREREPGTTRSQKKSAAAAVVVVAAPITPLKKGEEENARLLFFSLSFCVCAL